MLTRIQARNYRCLKRVDQSLTSFEVLVGGNGVGKSTFLDVISFLSEVLSQPRDGASAAIKSRSDQLEALLFDSASGKFELGVEAAVPASIRENLLWTSSEATLHYRIEIGYRDDTRRDVGILSEKLLLTTEIRTASDATTAQNQGLVEPPRSIPIVTRRGWPEEITVFQRETPSSSDSLGWSQFKISPNSSAFANLPEDPEQFPVATWFRRYLTEWVLKLTLEPEKLKRPMPVGFGNDHSPGILNVPGIVATFSATDKVRFRDWISHLKIALPDLQLVSVFERPEDRQRYLVVEYVDGRKVPSWLLSDGTLRLIGLTLPAYALDNGTIFLIEEPENCIHPLAIEIVMQSLSSMYESQVLVTTHSPAILSLTARERILCFSKTPEDGTMIVRGDKHPRLSAWKGSVDPGMLLASGILG